jgi:hypothetical protein
MKHVCNANLNIISYSLFKRTDSKNDISSEESQRFTDDVITLCDFKVAF